MTGTSVRRGLALVLWTSTVGGLGACVMLSPDGGAETQVVAPAGGSAAFKPVALWLDRRCGTLDCHGQVGRNFRLYGQYGLRLDPMNEPGGALMTSDELEADFRSAVSLEPELMAAVVQSGAAPDTLTLVRKPRGEESHKGGTLITVGDDQDTCLTSWLAGAVNVTACSSALKTAW